MALTVHIEEAATLRRLAGALATSLSKTARFEGRIDLDLSAGMFFRSFPWTGEIVVSSGLPDYQSATAGQYFLEFNWEGKPVDRGEGVFTVQHGDVADGGEKKASGRSSVSDVMDSLFSEDI